MATVPSDRELRGLEEALTRLLSPLEYSSAESWMRAVIDDTRQLLGASHAHFFIPGVGWHSDVPERAQQEFRAYYQQFDVAPLLAAQQRIQVSAYEELVGRKPFRNSEFFNDWVRPHRLFHNHGMSFPLNGATADAPGHPYLAVSLDALSREPEVERGVNLLRLLHPAFRAGVRACVALDDRRQDLLRTIDALRAPCMLWDDRTRLLHANPACVALLGRDPEAGRLEAFVARQARRLAALSRHGCLRARQALEAGERELETRRGRYRVRCSYLGEECLGGVAVLAELVPRFREPLSAAELRQRFRLTRQETRVAALLARGLANREVALALGISPHTARRHTEQVLHKLDVRTRAQVAERLLRPAGPE